MTVNQVLKTTVIFYRFAEYQFPKMNSSDQLVSSLRQSLADRACPACGVCINSGAIEKTILNFSKQGRSHRDKIGFVLSNVFTKAECDEIIAATEVRGYEPALVDIGGGKQTLMTDLRKNARCMWKNNELAEHIYARVAIHLPSHWSKRTRAGLNPLLRVLKYEPSDYFRAHYDGSYQDPTNKQRSYFTLQLYLNDEMKGGATRFIAAKDQHSVKSDSSGKTGDEIGEHGGANDIDIQPKAGSVLVFEHELLHTGCTVLEGKKYCVRTDVMYD